MRHSLIDLRHGIISHLCVVKSRRGHHLISSKGGRVWGIDQNIFFTMIQQIHISFQLLGRRLTYFTFTLELF